MAASPVNGLAADGSDNPVTQGYIALVLHAHLPFIRHPEQAIKLEERWLFEAITETYLPLLLALQRLQHDQIPFRLTLSLSPTLMGMLDDPLLRSRYQTHLEAMLELAEREVAISTGRPEHTIAHFYRHHLRQVRRLYQECGQDIVTAFHQFAKAGYLDLITCAATHGFLPLLAQQPAAVKAQIRTATSAYQHRFGHPPLGFWLPECGYFPGLDHILAEAGIKYCFLETHGLTHAHPAPPRGVYSHAWTPGGIAVFGRDAPSSRQVWSATEGYPGDFAYRDFYRDIGFEREPAHLGLLAGVAGVRTFSGLKYHRVTGPTDEKDWYDRWAAEQTAIRHAAHFLQERVRQVAELRRLLPNDGPPPIVVAPYDAELFGHWWYEGPLFLEQIARVAAQEQKVQFVTPAEYLRLYPEGQGRLEPVYSSWGERGYADFWCDEANHWLWPSLHRAGRSMAAMVNSHPKPSPLIERALNQALRELLLAQASDWPFILRTGTATEYAQGRIQTHLGRFAHICHGLQQGAQMEPEWLTLAEAEAADNLFPELSYTFFR